MNWRGWIAVGWVLLILVLLGGFAWLTHNPDADILDKAREWPVIGPLADRFQRAYMTVGTPPPEGSEAGEPATHVVVVFEPPEESLATQFVWVNPGAKLHEQPDPTSAVLHLMTVIGNLPVLGRQGDWYRVSRAVERFERQQGWVWLEDYQDPSPETLREPDPVLPLPARSPDPQAVALARSMMQAGSMEIDCGAYLLITDADDESLLGLCERLTRQVEEIYHQRYELRPVSPPAEAILLFRHAASYREFRDSQGVPWEFNTAHASPAHGYLAFYQGDRQATALIGTLVHELTHLINRRCLGPALPPWLSEGIADDLGESKIGADGEISPGVLGGEMQVHQLRIIRRGARAAVIDLQELLKHDALPTLETLVELDANQFYVGSTRTLNYALSSFWVRYLLSDLSGALRPGFRSFLQGIAEGQPISGERLLDHLDTDWDSLESGFRTWLRLQYLMPPNEVRAASD